MATHSIFLPEKLHGHRSLAGYSPWGCKESVTAEHMEQVYNLWSLSLSLSLSLSMGLEDPLPK